jgi:hypothetical protein
VSKQIGDRQYRFKQRKALSNRRNDNSLVLSKGENGEWTPHDLRRTGATMMQALGVMPDVIDRCQNHVLAGSRVRRHYLKAPSLTNLSVCSSKQASVNALGRPRALPALEEFVLPAVSRTACPSAPCPECAGSRFTRCPCGWGRVPAPGLPRSRNGPATRRTPG